MLVVLSEESHGQRNLVGYSPEGLKESDMTDHLSTKLLSIFPYARKNKLG